MSDNTPFTISVNLTKEQILELLRKYDNDSEVADIIVRFLSNCNDNIYRIVRDRMMSWE